MRDRGNKVKSLKRGRRGESKGKVKWGWDGGREGKREGRGRWYGFIKQAIGEV